MTELAVILCRLAQYSAASVLMGSALFFFYALPADGTGSAKQLRWPKPLLAVGALVLAAGAMFGLAAQTAVLAGSWAEALTAQALGTVVGQMDLGKAAVARAALAVLGFVYVLAVPHGRALWLGAGLLGALATATIGWMGHGAASEGPGHTIHLVADIVHALAAAGWIGALAAFVGLAFTRRQSSERLAATARALQRFSSVGVALVATLVVTGLVNAWLLVGTDIAAALRVAYGQLLALKLAMFAAMLGLATLHRQRSVPALAALVSSRTLPPGDGLAGLRRSLIAEASLGFFVLATVAWFGTLSPTGAM